jgi:hypothetical protein
MIQRMSDQHKIGFLEAPQQGPAETPAPTEQKKSLRQIAEEQRAKRLSDHDDGLKTTKHIGSARTGVITDMNGPSKYVKSETSNTVWDTDKTARLAGEAAGSKTETQVEKERIATNRREAEQRRMAELAETLKQTDQSKDATVTRLSDQGGSSYRVPSSGMSIFDTVDFERLAEKTGGEKISEDTATRRAFKDESWKNSGKALNSKDVMNRLFDHLFPTE